MDKKSSITNQLYSTVEKTLSSKEVKATYKTNIDKYMSLNTDKYFIAGIGDRPIFSDTDINAFISCTGLTKDSIKHAMAESKKGGHVYYGVIMNNPFNIANALATRYFTKTNDEEFIKLSKWYLIVSMYPSLHWKYFRKCNPNQACMEYTISNLSEKFNIRKTGSLWNALNVMIDTAYDFYKKNIINGSDVDYTKYIQDVHTRMNSLLRNISVEYYKNFNDQKYLGTEHESFDEEDYREADSNTAAIERITNKVVTHLVVNGPDMRLVEIAAKTNSVSVNDLRNYTHALISDKRRDDIHNIVEAMLFIYLFTDDGELHSPKDVGTNDFLIYCLKVYKRSNTTDKNVVKIKAILDKWLKDVGVLDKVSSQTTLLNFRKALFTFFVLTIQKLA